MSGVWAIGELVEGRPTRLTLELASLASALGTGAGRHATVVLVGGDERAATEIARHGPAVLAVPAEGADPEPRDVAAVAATLIEERVPDVVLVGASPDGRDVAGMLVGLTELPILVAAAGVALSEGRLIVDMATFGGRLLTSSTFSGERGIVLVRPGTVEAEAAATAGAIEALTVSPSQALAEVSVVDRVVEAPAGPSIDDARVIVGAGRGVGGPDGLALVGELAAALEGAVGATRAAVDSGWIDFGQQIGQTGKAVKPELYIACGISGAIQHKVGVQSAGTIVAINKDPDAPISEFADLVVVGDLFEIVPRLTQAIRESRGS